MCETEVSTADGARELWSGRSVTYCTPPCAFLVAETISAATCSKPCTRQHMRNFRSMGNVTTSKDGSPQTLSLVRRRSLVDRDATPSLVPCQTSALLSRRLNREAKRSFHFQMEILHPLQEPNKEPQRLPATVRGRYAVFPCDHKCGHARGWKAMHAF